ncbi:hypothetical protein Q4S45_17525 [Massilia sp. R2A-15]|uniref:hypothetical protein n=1 Tax=Massilia sp. R2A-15 TaxID=3064278 RepID=UPI00273608E6|nr:hypothetical protein [Massilia sp. R2A-15]WLI88513.1 hypothetical protein Q4S45_17525 [Massilia sp. R2A-15]
MSFTSLELPDELEERVAHAAQKLGISTDTFMIDAIRHAANATGTERSREMDAGEDCEWNVRHASVISVYNCQVEAEGVALQEWRAL